MSTIKLKCSDGVILEVDVAVAKYSNTLKTLLENVADADEDEVLPIPNVNSDTMKNFIEWASYHNSRENPTTFDDLYPHSCIEGSIEIAIDHLSSWDTNFISKLNQEKLFELTNAANYLDIKGLLDICCMTIAKQIAEMRPEEIRLAFNIENDLTESDEEQIRRENAWYEDK